MKSFIFAIIAFAVCISTSSAGILTGYTDCGSAARVLSIDVQGCSRTHCNNMVAGSKLLITVTLVPSISSNGPMSSVFSGRWGLLKDSTTQNILATFTSGVPTTFNFTYTLPPVIPPPGTTITYTGLGTVPELTTKPLVCVTGPLSH